VGHEDPRRRRLGLPGADLQRSLLPGFSDPTLQPETSFSYDFGIDQKLWKDRIRLGLTYFHNDFKNLIGFTFTATTPFVKGVNIGTARTEGIEFTSEVDVLDNLTASLTTPTRSRRTSRPTASCA